MAAGVAAAAAVAAESAALSDPSAVNQVIAGFTRADGAVSLTPVQNASRAVLVLRRRPDGVMERRATTEPSHDSNKIYATVAGVVRASRIPMLLEAAGVPDTRTGPRGADALAPWPPKTASAAEETEAAAEEAGPGEWPPLVGSAWLTDGARPSATTRLALAVWDGERWSLYVDTVAAIFGGEAAWAWDRIDALVASVVGGSRAGGALVLPILQPLRKLTPQGVVFVG